MNEIKLEHGEVLKTIAPDSGWMDIAKAVLKQNEAILRMNEKLIDGAFNPMLFLSKNKGVE